MGLLQTLDLIDLMCTVSECEFRVSLEQELIMAQLISCLFYISYYSDLSFSKMVKNQGRKVHK